jgi:hypothetical protein
MELSVVRLNSRAARYIVTPNRMASTAMGTECAGPGRTETRSSEPSCRTLNSTKLRPATERKKAAVEIEPHAITT